MKDSLNSPEVTREEKSPPKEELEVKPQVSIKTSKALSSDDHVTSNIDSTHSVSEFEPTT